jgi:hypothetical protein
MNTADRREILSRVAAGTISPEEAATQLDSIRTGEEPADSGIRKVQIERQLGTLEIIGDPNVRDAVAEGPHQARIEGDVMIVSRQTTIEHGGFFFGVTGFAGADKLVVRMNPALALEFQMQAGSCRVRGVEGPIRADIQAGSATIDGFRGALNLSVQAGSVKASGRLDHDESRINCDAGSVSLNLEPGSSVRISARASMGKVELPGDSAINGGGVRAATVGDGDATLSIECHMGSVKVGAGW